MSFKGFYTESKLYMGYPNCGMVYFWKRYPIAFIKYHWYSVKDWWNWRKV